jgi:hypothetical protein
MPAIADPYRARPYVERPDSNRDPNTHALEVRIRTALQRDELTRAPAEGDPTTRKELSLRATQLTSARRRRTLARATRRTIAEAHKPPLTRPRIDSRSVLGAEDAINAMIDRLTSSDPVRAEGMAITARILTNAERSPHYNRSEPGSIRRVITLATAAPDSPHSAIARASDRKPAPQPLSHQPTVESS